MNKPDVISKFLNYVKFDTQSDDTTGTSPSTMKQHELAKFLVKELNEIGASDVFYDEEHCYVYASIPSNIDDGVKRPAIGFISHMDTSDEVSGKDVNPRQVENYDGGDIVLNKELGVVLSPADFPELLNHVGETLIVTDGTTLLGGDDKASIAAIMTMAEYLCRHDEIEHGDISLAFPPDEEVGGLARDLDLDRFGAKLAYTLDGDHLGWYEDETFNASEAVFEFIGRSVHTGTAKGIMVNAVDMAAHLMGMLPPGEKPQFTEGTEGFYHVISCVGDCENAKVRLLVRDFDHDNFCKREDFLRVCADDLKEKYGQDRVALTITHQYSNMQEVLKESPFLVGILRDAIKKAGIEPVCEPFRGGTDGAALSFRGLPCPNLSAGYENAHGRFEYVPIQSMVKNVEILLNICESMMILRDGVTLPTTV